jgi:hypothetical protein
VAPDSHASNDCHAKAAIERLLLFIAEQVHGVQVLKLAQHTHKL